MKKKLANFFFGDLLLILVFCLSACNVSTRQNVHYIPGDFKGEVIILFDVPGTPPLNIKNNKLAYRIPSSGIYLTSSKFEPGWYFKHPQFFDEFKGQIVELPRSTSSVRSEERQVYNLTFCSTDKGQVSIRYFVGFPGYLTEKDYFDMKNWNEKRETHILNQLSKGTRFENLQCLPPYQKGMTQSIEPVPYIFD